MQAASSDLMHSSHLVNVSFCWAANIMYVQGNSVLFGSRATADDQVVPGPHIQCVFGGINSCPSLLPTGVIRPLLSGWLLLYPGGGGGSEDGWVG